MDKPTNENVIAQGYLWNSTTLSQYIQLRNGVPLGHPHSLRNILQRSLGAGSFAAFWQYWNLIQVYGLGKFVYLPLRRIFPPLPAFILTFIASGSIPDFATMAIRRSFAILFTPWFLLLGISAVASQIIGINLVYRNWWIRAGENISYLHLSLAITIVLRQIGWLL